MEGSPVGGPTGTGAPPPAATEPAQPAGQPTPDRAPVPAQEGGTPRSSTEGGRAEPPPLEAPVETVPASPAGPVAPTATILPQGVSGSGSATPTPEAPQAQQPTARAQSGTVMSPDMASGVGREHTDLGVAERVIAGRGIETQQSRALQATAKNTIDDIYRRGREVQESRAQVNAAQDARDKFAARFYTATRKEMDGAGLKNPPTSNPAQARDEASDATMARARATREVARQNAEDVQARVKGDPKTQAGFKAAQAAPRGSPAEVMSRQAVIHQEASQRELKAQAFKADESVQKATAAGEKEKAALQKEKEGDKTAATRLRDEAGKLKQDSARLASESTEHGRLAAELSDVTTDRAATAARFSQSTPTPEQFAETVTGGFVDGDEKMKWSPREREIVGRTLQRVGDKSPETLAGLRSTSLIRMSQHPTDPNIEGMTAIMPDGSTRVYIFDSAFDGADTRGDAVLDLEGVVVHEVAHTRRDFAAYQKQFGEDQEGFAEDFEKFYFDRGSLDSDRAAFFEGRAGTSSAAALGLSGSEQTFFETAESGAPKPRAVGPADIRDTTIPGTERGVRAIISGAGATEPPAGTSFEALRKAGENALDAEEGRLKAGIKSATAEAEKLQTELDKPGLKTEHDVAKKAVDEADKAVADMRARLERGLTADLKPDLSEEDRKAYLALISGQENVAIPAGAGAKYFSGSVNDTEAATRINARRVLYGTNSDNVAGTLNPATTGLTLEATDGGFEIKADPTKGLPKAAAEARKKLIETQYAKAQTARDDAIQRKLEAEARLERINDEEGGWRRRLEVLSDVREEAEKALKSTDGDVIARSANYARSLPGDTSGRTAIDVLANPNEDLGRVRALSNQLAGMPALPSSGGGSDGWAKLNSMTGALNSMSGFGNSVSGLVDSGVSLMDTFNSLSGDSDYDIASGNVTLGIMMSSARDREESRKTERLLQMVIMAVKAGNTDMISTALIILSRKGKETLINAAMGSIRSLEAFERQQTTLNRQIQRLSGREKNYGAKLQRISNDMNRVSMNRQMQASILRDIKSMEEELEYMAKSYLDVRGPQLRAVSRWTA